jgi:3-hydroxyacyl-[acyl-carrier-protein] dehydratase
MRFSLVDKVLERSDARIVTIKNVSSAEEYLKDHFSTFPVLPGVMMLECMVQSGRLLAEAAVDPTALPLVLGRVRALKYGRFVVPGDTIQVEVDLAKHEGDSWDFKGQVVMATPQREVAASCRFVLRPARVGVAVPAGT